MTFASISAAGAAAIVIIVVLVVYVVMALPTSGVFAKAGRPRWAAFVPIYNTLTLLDVVGRPLWWIFLLFIPGANIIFTIIVMNDLAKSFGQGPGFTVGLVLISWVFMLVLWLGPSDYLRPAADPARFKFDGRTARQSRQPMSTGDIVYVTFSALVILFVLGAAIAVHTGFVIVLCVTSALIFGVFMAAGFLPSTEAAQQGSRSTPLQQT